MSLSIFSHASGEALHTENHLVKRVPEDETRGATIPPMTTKAIPSPKLSPIVYFIGFTAALAGLLFGLDVGVISGAQQFIAKDFKIGDRDIELIVSALLWGAVFGTLISGMISSHFGRRRTISSQGWNRSAKV